MLNKAILHVINVVLKDLDKELSEVPEYIIYVYPDEVPENMVELIHNNKLVGTYKTVEEARRAIELNKCLTT